MVSAAGAVATSAGLTSAGWVSSFADGGGAEAVESILKSLAVGGGTLAGSGLGIAASMASSAALLRPWSWAMAEVADTVRKVAATAIRTRSNPRPVFKLRLFKSRIVTPLG